MKHPLAERHGLCRHARRWPAAAPTTRRRRRRRGDDDRRRGRRHDRACAPRRPAATTPAASTVASSTPPGSTPSEAAARIVSLSPTATEMLYAIGAGDQVVAVDQYSNYPAEVLQKPHDLDGLNPNVEAIAKFEPDLVVMDADNGLGDQLSSVGIDSWVGPAAVTFDDIYTQLEQLGAATGHVADAAKVVAEMQTDIATAVAAVPDTAAGLTLLPRARPDVLQRHLEHVHRHGVRPVRPEEHRRRRPAGQRLPAAVVGVHRPGRPGSDLPGRQQVLPAGRRDRGGPARAGTRSPR